MRAAMDWLCPLGGGAVGDAGMRLPARDRTATGEPTGTGSAGALRSFRRTAVFALIGALVVVGLFGAAPDALALAPTTTSLTIGGLEGYSANPAVVGQTTLLSASVLDNALDHKNTGTVTFTTGTTVLCTTTLGSDSNAGCWWIPSAAGTYQFKASYSGDSAYAASSGTLSVVVRANTTYSTYITLDQFYPTQTDYAGSTGWFWAQVSSGLGPVPNGTVTFYEGAVAVPGCTAVPVSGGEADCAPYYGTVGSHTLTAAYNGGQDSVDTVGVRVYSPSGSSPSVTATVVKDPTTVSLSSYVSGNYTSTTVFPGEAVTFTADVNSTYKSTSLVGTVAFTSGGSTIPGCGAVPVGNDRAWEGFASCTTSYSTAGSPQVVASYSGNDVKLPSSSAPFTEQVEISPTATNVASSENPALINTTVTYTAHVGGGLGPTPGYGTVTFKSGTATITGCAAVALSGGNAMCSTTYPAAGSPQVTATYNGGTQFATSTSSVFSEQVLASATATSTALTASPNPAVVGQAVTYTAKVTGSGGTVSAGTVAFTSGGITIAGCGSVTVLVGSARCSTTFAQTGSPQVIATYTGGASFAGSTSAALTEQVAPAPTTTSCQASAFSDVFSPAALIVATSVTGATAPTSWPAVNAITGFIYSMSLGGQGIAPDIYGCDYPGVVTGYSPVPVNMVLTGYSWTGGFNAPMTFTGIVTPATEALLMANAAHALSFQFALEGPANEVLASGRALSVSSLSQKPSQPAAPAITSTTLQNPTLVRTTTTSGGQAADVVQFTVPAPTPVKPNPTSQLTYAPCPTGAVSGACGSAWNLTWGYPVAAPLGGLLPTYHRCVEPKLIGLTVGGARRRLAAAGCGIVVRHVHSVRRRGRVVRVSGRAGRRYRAGHKVQVYVGT